MIRAAVFLWHIDGFDVSMKLTYPVFRCLFRREGDLPEIWTSKKEVLDSSKLADDCGLLTDGMESIFATVCDFLWKKRM